MLHMEPPPHQGIYAPLSQVMSESDDDSEEEIHNTSKLRRQRQQQQQQVQQQQQRNRIPPSSLPLNQQRNHNHQQQQQLQQQLHIERGDDEEQRHRQRQRMLQQQERKYYFNNGVGNGGQQHPQQKPPSSYTTNMQNTFRSVMMSDIGLAGHETSNGAAAPFDANGSSFSTFNSDYDERQHIDADNVAILGGHNDEKLSNEPMSPARRCCFIASVLLCIFTVFGFVWFVPCGDADSDGACPARPDRSKTHNWLHNYTKVELMGGIHIVNGLRSWENNLIFLYRGDVFFPEYEPSKTKRNGIISLIGSSGVVAWYDEMTDEPVGIDCTLLDVDRNGRPDCLVIDEYGQLGAINPLSGQWFWRYKERSAYKVSREDFPLMLPDLDGDGVLELLTVSSATLEQRTKAYVQQGNVRTGKAERNALRIVSGRRGTPIGEGLKLHDCDVVRKLQLEHGQTVTFNCVRNNTAAQRSKTLAELFALITNKSTLAQRKKLPAAVDITQHRHHYTDAQRNIYSLSGRELLVENRGKCPEDCTISVVLSETRNGRFNVLHNMTGSAMYGMVPTQWHLKNTASKRPMSGFVIKFWQWHGASNLNAPPGKKPQKLYTMKKAKSSSSKTATPAGTNSGDANSKPNQTHQPNPAKRHDKFPRRKRSAKDTEQNSVFDEFIEKRNTVYPVDGRAAFLRTTRSINLATGNSTNKMQQQQQQQFTANRNPLVDNYKMQIITETVMLMLFVGADTQCENTSQSHIMQLCRRHHNSDGSIEELCQPDLRNHENSMVIADIDQDGSQELVSYMTTFVSTDGDTTSTDPNADWKLLTYVNLLRLESELPNIFDAPQSHN